MVVVARLVLFCVFERFALSRWRVQTALLEKEAESQHLVRGARSKARLATRYGNS